MTDGARFWAWWRDTGGSVSFVVPVPVDPPDPPDPTSSGAFSAAFGEEFDR